MDLHRVSISTLEEAWPTVAPMLQPCIEMLNGEFNLDDVWLRLHSCDWQLWVVVEGSISKFYGAVVTEVILYPRKKVLRILLLGGEEFAKWLDLFKYIEDWAVGQGCSGAEAWCRPGMSKHMKTLGFVPKLTVQLKNLLEPNDETRRIT